MDGEIRPGDHCTVYRDVVIEDQLAFLEGEPVTVERVEPSPGMPQYKYVVYSRSMRRRFLLSEADLRSTGGSRGAGEYTAGAAARAPFPDSGASTDDAFSGAYSGGPGDVFGLQGPPQVAPRPREPAPTGIRRFKTWHIVVSGIALAVIGLLVVLAFIRGGPERPPGIPADWKSYESRGTRLWLPPDWPAGMYADELPGVKSQLTDPGAGYEAMVDLVGSGGRQLVLYAIDAGTVPGIRSSMVALVKHMPEGMQAADLILMGVVEPPAGFTQLSQKVVKVGGRDAVLMLMEGTADSETVRTAVYVIPGSNYFYQVNFTCAPSELESLTPLFEKIAGSIKSLT